MPFSTRLRRLAYRTAYVLLRVYWFLLHPRHTGVKALLTSGDQVLLVRHTYGPAEWELPGGSLRRSEDPAAGATREVREELGLQLSGWTSLGEVHGELNHVKNTLHVFAAEIGEVELTLDPGEIDRAKWFPRSGLPGDLGHYSAMILGRDGSRGGGTRRTRSA